MQITRKYQKENADQWKMSFMFVVSLNLSKDQEVTKVRSDYCFI